MLEEFRLIEWIRKRRQQLPESLLQGIGDDCAVLDASRLGRMCVTTDSLVEGTHFRLRWSSPRLLGRKALAVSISDLAAMGARPHACLLSLTVPRGFPDGSVLALIKGFLEECKRYRCPLAGGNLSSGSSVQLAVTAWGTVESGRPVLRSTARPGDLVALAGEVGLARAGLELLKREDPDLQDVDSQSELQRWAGGPMRFKALKAHLLPAPPLEVGIWVRRNDLASAMIDVSDGLAADLMHVLRASRLRAVLQTGPDSFLARRSRRLGLTMDCLLNGGEDYALLWTLPAQQRSRWESAYPSDFPACGIIGGLEVGAPAVFLEGKHSRERLEVSGFQHFSETS